MRTLTVQGIEQVLSPGWQISDKINARTTASFSLPYLTTLTDIEAGDEVILLDDVTVIFAGNIEDVSTAQNGTLIEYSLSCTDYAYLAGKRTVYGSYESKTLTYIITDLITNFLGGEGVTLGTMPDVTIEKAVFNYISGTQALDQLRDAIGMNWNIDFDKALNFFARESTASPWSVTDSTPVKNLRVEKSKGEYRNRQYIRGGYGRTSSVQTESPTPKPDGQSRNFVLRFPVAEKPQIFINAVEVSASDIGVNGLDSNKKWYFSYNSNVIGQDEAETVLSDLDAISIQYTGLYPILAVVESVAEIADRAANEPGTSGIYETLTVENSIKDGAQAITYAQALLLKYGRIPRKVTFSTET